MNTNTSFNEELVQDISVEGKGENGWSTLLERDGFKISGGASIGENFIGVNISGTDDKWNNHNISYKLEVSNKSQPVAIDKRNLTISELRSCGSLGTFYSGEYKNSLIESHTVKLSLKVTPINQTKKTTETNNSSDKFITSLNDSKLTTSNLTAFYFSAHWCPPCRNFTPKLAEFYNRVNRDSKRIEIVFVSGDQDEESFQEYFNTMPWLAIPLGDPLIDQLNSEHNVEGIPYLVVLNQGKVVSTNGREQVSNSILDNSENSEIQLINSWLN